MKPRIMKMPKLSDYDCFVVWFPNGAMKTFHVKCWRTGDTPLSRLHEEMKAYAESEGRT